MRDQDLKSERFNTENGQVTLGESLGSGAEGAVYELKNNKNMAAKIFEPSERADKKGKIKAMIENDPNDPTENKTGYKSLVWPEDLLYNKPTGEFVGYIMPSKNMDDNKNIQRYASEELDWSGEPSDRIYAIGYNLAVAVKNIHNQGHALGDMNHQNILVNDNGYVSLIDCDGFQIQGRNKTYRESVQFQRYAPPEGRGSTLKEVQTSDRFGLGVHIFQLLMKGFHPYQAGGSEAAVSPPRKMIVENDFVYGNPQPGEMEPHDHAPDYTKLPSKIRDLFDVCFKSGKDTYPEHRPTPNDWENILNDILGNSQPDPDDNDEEGPTIKGPDRWNHPDNDNYKKEDENRTDGTEEDDNNSKRTSYEEITEADERWSN